MIQVAKKKLRTLKSHVDRYGPREAAWVLVAQPMENLGFLAVGHCYALDLHHALPAEEQYEPGMVVRELTKSEIEAQAAQGEHWFFPGAVEESLCRGDRCFGVFVQDVLACSNWCTTRPLRQFGLQLSCSEDAFFGYRMFTVPQFRGRRLQRILRHFVARQYIGDGYRWYLNTMYSTNSASIRAATNCGFQRVGTIVRIGSRARGRAWLFNCDHAKLWTE